MDGVRPMSDLAQILPFPGVDAAPGARPASFAEYLVSIGLWRRISFRRGAQMVLGALGADVGPLQSGPVGLPQVLGKPFRLCLIGIFHLFRRTLGSVTGVTDPFGVLVHV